MTFDEYYNTKRTEQEREYIQRALANSDTRKILGMLLEESGFLAPSMNAKDPYITAYREGQRITGQRIFELLLTASDAKPLSCMKEYARDIAELRKNALLTYNQNNKNELI